MSTVAAASRAPCVLLTCAVHVLCGAVTEMETDVMLMLNNVFIYWMSYSFKYTLPHRKTDTWSLGEWHTVADGGEGAFARSSGSSLNMTVKARWAC